jgi:hypothetical protein
MNRWGPAAALLLSCGGCFSAQPGAERSHERVRKGMTRDDVLYEIGAPKERHRIPGQGDAPDLPVEQWRYQWNYGPGKTMTILFTAFIGLFFMDLSPYGFDVGFDRDGKVRAVSEVGRRR